MAKKELRKKGARRKQKQVKSSTFFSKFWQEKSPVFKFIAGFLGCILVFYAL